MNDNTASSRSPAVAIANACWTSIGVHGDRSCPELTEYVHCRNCPVYSAAAMHVLDGEFSAADIASWTGHFAAPKPVKELNTRSIVIFRLGLEWLALPTPCVAEVSNLLPIHTIPHRRSPVVLGLASVRGELLVCVSLGRMLGLEPSPAAEPRTRGTVHRRLLVIERDHARAVCPVDEVYGTHRFHPRELKDAPATVAGAAGTYSRALLSWNQRSVGLLDAELLFHSLKRSMA